MPSINSNIAALIAHQGLLRANADLTIRLERLSTGLRINRASDDPAGLVRADRLSMELRGLRAAVDASERGAAMIAAIDGQLAAIAEHLETLKALVAETGDSGGPSPQERQLAIDAALSGIESIANQAVFGGQRLLDGSLQYTHSPLNRDRILSLDIHQADLASGTLGMLIRISRPAERGLLLTPLNSGSFTNGTLGEDLSLELRGNLGVRTLHFASGTTAATMIAAINQIRYQTGIQSRFESSGGVNYLIFETTEYGSDQEVEIHAVEGGASWVTFRTAGGAIETRDTGEDVAGTVNGIPWQGRGLSLYFTSPVMTFSATLTTEFGATQPVPGPESIFINGGGIAFQTGVGSSSNDRVSFGVPAVVPSRLGRILSMNKDPLTLEMLRTGQSLAVGQNNEFDAGRVVDAAIAEVSLLRARLGNIDRTRLSGAIDALQSAIEAATIGESRIRDADLAAETSAMVRAQILSQSSIAMIGAANANAEALLRLLAR